MNLFSHYYPRELSLPRVKASLVKAHETFVDVLRPLENVADYARKLNPSHMLLYALMKMVFSMVPARHGVC